MKRLYPLFTMLLIEATAFAQTPTDMEFVPAGNICVGANYGYSAWKKYWQGENLIENGNVGTVSTQFVGAGFALGIIDRLNFMASLPYVFTNASSGTLNGQHGLQDIYLNVKGNYGEIKLGPGKIRFAGDLGFKTPVSKYLVDFAPLSIGTGTTNLSYRQLVSYKLDKGFYLDLKGNYTYRSNIPDIHRDFYYDQGGDYYTNEVNVPDVFDWAVAVGFSNKKLLAELSFLSYNTLGGSDIRLWDPGFPTNNIDANSINGRFDYYFSKPKGLNFSVNTGYVVSGRNTGQSLYGNIGVNYFFPIWKERPAEDKPVK
ncbi:MAG: transporter [Chitinophagales bacterium]